MIPITNTFRIHLGMAAMALSVAAIQPVVAQNTLPGDLRINGKTVWEAFEPQRQVLQKSSAVIYTDEKSRIMKIYGTVVSEDGYILTKASEIEGASQLSLRIGSELYRDVEVVNVDEQWDVAMLKITPVAPLEPAMLSDSESAQQGSWVISNGSTTRSQRRVKVGIVSAITREIKAPEGRVVMGVQLGEDDEKGLELKKVTPKSGGEKAGLKEGDFIKSVDGEKITKREDLLKLMKDKKDGDKIAVEVDRDGKSMKFDVELSALPAGPQRLSRNDQMSGGDLSLSKRRDAFPRVLHHDTPLIKDRIGGPLLNLDGVCIGMNIARASRVATFAIPARELSEIILRLKK
ncbi:hypothetical protein NT6N_39550 [Oceaniferula spumae]|uniref:PDZ domain-containing protein n=1 Tax=Oceaniferula spumae TaxID=2979115 RepID=A0AAT9FSL0_9BACT